MKDSKETVAVSEYLKKAMLSFKANVRIIPNTINFDFFVPGVNRNEEQLIMINLLTENKQVYKGIDAFKCWKSKHTNGKMYIIGDGPEKSSLERLAENEKVYFPGEQKESDWIEILQSSACLLLMSKSETFGVVILEALACHIPVSYTHLDVYKRQVQEQLGLPVEWKEERIDLGFRIDLKVENKLIIELKSIETILPVHKKQLLTYIRLSKIKLGLLVNFNENLLKDGLHRVVNNL